jgi:hypothetical protein
LSTRQAGNRRENRFGDALESRNYFVSYSRGSRGIDVVAIGLKGAAPHILAEVGGIGKRVRSSFAKLRAAPSFPGSRKIVARELKHKGRCFWRVYTDPDTSFDDIDAALESLRAASS